MISNGAKFEINKLGTSIKYYPGIITNNDGKMFEFNCGPDRNITYYLEYIVLLSLFGKQNLSVTLLGLTNDEFDISMDNFINITLPLIKQFQVEGDLSAKIHKRGYRSDAGGEVELHVPIVRFLRSVQLKTASKIKRIRGTAAGARISPTILKTITSKVQEIMGKFTSDIWINQDMCKSSKAGSSSGFSLNLIAETEEGQMIGVDDGYDLRESQDNNLPDFVAERCVQRLLDEILYSGAVDTASQTVVLNLMSLTEKQINCVLLGRLSAFTIENLRLLRQFFGVTYSIEQDAGNWSADQEEDDDDDEEESESQKDAAEEGADDGDAPDKIKEETQLQQQEAGLEGSSAKEAQDKKQAKKKKIRIPSKMLFSCYGIGLQNLSRMYQ